jgi:alpha-galactosidase
VINQRAVRFLSRRAMRSAVGRYCLRLSRDQSFQGFSKFSPDWEEDFRSHFVPPRSTCAPSDVVLHRFGKPRVGETSAVFKKLCCVRFPISIGILVLCVSAGAHQSAHETLSLSVNARDGSYELAVRGGRLILASGVGAQINHEWLRSNSYPHHQIFETSFADELGSGHAVSVTFTGVAGKPDLIYVAQIYDQRPYAALQVRVRNATNQQITVQAIRSVEARGDPRLNLGGHPSSDRILSDSFSEDWPPLYLYDLGKAPGGMHRGAGSQLIYNRESGQSLFLGALTSDRFLTLLRLEATGGTGAETQIASFTVDSTGTTEVQKEFDLQNAPAENQIELSLPLAPGAEMHSERLLLQAGSDYHGQLLAYGDAIRRLHHARVSVETPIGWWSWTAFYGGINEGVTLANADWQAEHLKSLGYKYFQIDEGYQYARGEYATANATQFPDGLRFVGHRITADGLTFGIWTGPFQVTSRAWVYEHHKDWLVHNAKGEPISSGDVWNQKTDFLYTLDTTHPGAREYLRQTYKTLIREWGVRFIKLDFMDTTAIEGYRYRPNTTALEAQRIGLQIIRDTVGEDVVLDKDGSPMLNAVGLLDTGRISTDTAHSFEATKRAAPGIAARFYMNRNFFVNDPDAFNTTAQPYPERPKLPTSLPLSAAQASIALSAISGGMYEIGDDMLILGSQKDRLALVENTDLLNIAKIGRASTPLDLMSYEPEDEQPSVFFLRESPRQAILTVFNWTKVPRSHAVKLSELGLPAEHALAGSDVLNEYAPIALAGGVVRIESQAPESVKVIKLIDTTVPPAAPTVKAQLPSTATAGETIHLSAQTESAGVPAIGYHWDFGDGISANGPNVSHAYTRAGEFTIRLTVDGVEGVPAVQIFRVQVTGTLKAFPKLKDNRRFQDQE